MRLRKTIQNGHFTAKVYADPEWNEYRIKFYEDGKHMGEELDTFESCEEDAIATAEAELQFMTKRAENV